MNLNRAWMVGLGALCFGLLAADLGAESPVASPAGGKLLVDGAPLAKAWEPPAYPKELQKARVQGEVTARFVVDETGAVQRLRTEGEADPRLAPLLLESIRKAAFEPALVSGKPIAADVSMTWRFSLPYQPSLLAPIRMLPKTAATPERTPSPLYPPRLNERRLDGEVLTELVVGKDGAVREVTVLNATTADFIPPALEAVKAWRFQPARQGELPIEDRKIVPLTFEYEPGVDELASSPLTAADLKLDLPEGVTEREICDRPPETVVWVDPVFPLELLHENQPAEAEVSFSVNPQGVPENVSVRTATKPEAGAALRAAVEASLFRPAMKDGRSVVVTLIRRHRFSGPAAEPEEKEGDEARLLRLLRAGQAIPSGKGLDARIHPVWRTQPVLPEALRESGAPGTAEVEFVIDRTGRARVPRVLNATLPELGWAAATAVAQWVFDPPTRGGQPVDVRLRVPMEFKPN